MATLDSVVWKLLFSLLYAGGGAKGRFLSNGASARKNKTQKKPPESPQNQTLGVTEPGQVNDFYRDVSGGDLVAASVSLGGRRG